MLATSTALSILLFLVNIFATAKALSWTRCGVLNECDCATLSVPLEYGGCTPSKLTANISLIRYNATVNPSQRLGSLLFNPGGPGLSGVTFVSYGGGQAVSNLSGGFYDIVGFDPRGVGKTTPLLECFPSAGAEYNLSSTVSNSPNLWLGMFSNSSYDGRIRTEISNFDSSIKTLAKACVKQNSLALYTSSPAYVARDMVAIVDALDGRKAKLNYWGVSYGTIFLSEFIQTFPDRVGRVISDGVVNPKVNAGTYADQLPVDQLSVRAAMNDFVNFCQANSTNCPLAISPAGISGTLGQRLDLLFEDLFLNPIQQNGQSVSLDTFNVFLDDFLRAPAAWPVVARIIQELEQRNATSLLSWRKLQAGNPPLNPNGPGVGTLNQFPLICVSNAPSSNITLDNVGDLIKNVSVSEKTPLLSADLTSLSFCRHFPDTRPKIPVAGISGMADANKILSSSNTTILILNNDHDPATPLASARYLRSLLPNSSVLAIRGGSGHTTPSIASLSLAQTISDFFTAGLVPLDNVYHNIDQVIFPPQPVKNPLAPVLNGTDYSEGELRLLQATYDIIIAFALTQTPGQRNL